VRQQVSGVYKLCYVQVFYFVFNIFICNLALNICRRYNDFFAELYVDSDSEEFLGFYLPDLEDSRDVFDEEFYLFYFVNLDKKQQQNSMPFSNKRNDLEMITR